MVSWYVIIVLVLVVVFLVDGVVDEISCSDDIVN